MIRIIQKMKKDLLFWEKVIKPIFWWFVIVTVYLIRLLELYPQEEQLKQKQINTTNIKEVLA